MIGRKLMGLKGKYAFRAKLLDDLHHIHTAKIYINVKDASNKQSFVFPRYEHI